MSKAMTVGQLRAELALIPADDDDVPLFLYDLNTCDVFPLECVDPTISDRIDLNFSSKEESNNA